MSKLLPTKLGAITENFNNKRVPLSIVQRKNLDKKYRYYGAQGVIDYVDEYIFNGAYILIAEDGENLKSQKNNVCTYVTGKFWVNNHAHVIAAKNNNDTKYLFYKLCQVNFKNYVTGSAQPKLTKENLDSIVIYIHTTSEQNKIAEVLSILDKKIELNNRINTELEAMAKTLYDYWFVQFDFPDKDGKPYKSSGGKMVYNATLKREVPDEWKVESILKSCDVVDCLHSKKPDSTYEAESYYLLQLENILNNGLIDIAEKYYVSQKDYNLWTSRIEVKQHDVVMTNAGRTAAFAQVPDNVICGIGRNITAIRPKAIRPNYFFISLGGLDIQRQILTNLDNGAFFKSFNVKGIKALQLVRPTKELEQKFENTVKPIIDKRNLLVRENLKLVRLRDWLLPMLMNGQVTVK